MSEPTEAQMEILSAALSAYYSAVAAVRRSCTFETARAEMRAVNVLMDAIADIDGYLVAISLPSYGDLAEHAAVRVADWLRGAQ